MKPPESIMQSIEVWPEEDEPKIRYDNYFHDTDPDQTEDERYFDKTKDPDRYYCRDMIPTEWLGGSCCECDRESTTCALHD